MSHDEGSDCRGRDRCERDKCRRCCWCGLWLRPSQLHDFATALFYVCKAIGPPANPGIFQVYDFEVAKFLDAGYERAEGYDHPGVWFGVRKVAPVRDWWTWFDAARSWVSK